MSNVDIQLNNECLERLTSLLYNHAIFLNYLNSKINTLQLIMHVGVDRLFMFDEFNNQTIRANKLCILHLRLDVIATF